MLDRLELYTSLNMRNVGKRFKMGGVGTSKLIIEDEDLKELKYKNGTALYQNLFIETFAGNSVTGEMFDDPISFYIFAFPRFKRARSHEFKIVCNPSRITLEMLRAFLWRSFDPVGNFDAEPLKVWSQFSRHFRLGRVDFAVDLSDFSVVELKKMIFISNKLRKHTSIFSLNDDGRGYFRTIGGAELETFYIGAGAVVLRVYDKRKEARYQVGVFRREGKPIPARLSAVADGEQKTRIEMQLRSVGTSGNVINSIGKEIFKPSRGFHHLRTLFDLLNCKEENFDIFSDVHFEKLESTEYFKESWKNKAFNALIKEVGFDESVKSLTPHMRRLIKNKIIKKEFTHNLNSIIFQEFKQWQRT